MSTVHRMGYLSLFLLLLNVATPAETVTLAWFGNSYTGLGAQDQVLPVWVNCDTCGYTRTDSLVITLYSKPSCWLSCHEINWPAFTVIDQGHYDYVLAQDGMWSNLGSVNLTGKADQLTTWANHTMGPAGPMPCGPVQPQRRFTVTW